jgi:hypothetical protein
VTAAPAPASHSVLASGDGYAGGNGQQDLNG